MPIPTINEVLESLNGSAVFSKLDLRWGFHQFEFDADSSDITARANHDGILGLGLVELCGRPLPSLLKPVILVTKKVSALSES